MDNPSGSAPFTMSGARLFKPGTRVTFGGFKPGFAAVSVMFFASPVAVRHGACDDLPLRGNHRTRRSDKNRLRLFVFKNSYAVKVIFFDELFGGIKFNLDSESQIGFFAVETPEQFVHGSLELATDVRVRITVAGNTGSGKDIPVVFIIRKKVFSGDTAGIILLISPVKVRHTDSACNGVIYFTHQSNSGNGISVNGLFHLVLSRNIVGIVDCDDLSAGEFLFNDTLVLPNRA